MLEHPVSNLLSCHQGHLDVVKYLRGQAEDKTPKRNDGVTPLHLAAFTGHLDVVKYLCGQVQDKNPTADGYGLVTPLHLAARYRHADVVRYLVTVVGVKYPKDTNGDTPLDLVKQYRPDDCHVVRSSGSISCQYEESEIITILEKYDEEEEQTQHLIELLEDVQQLKSYFQKGDDEVRKPRGLSDEEWVKSLRKIEKHFAQKVQEAQAKQKQKIDYYQVARLIPGLYRQPQAEPKEIPFDPTIPKTDKC